MEATNALFSPKDMPPVTDQEHKDLCKGRKTEAQASYKNRIKCTAEEAEAIIEYWYNLTFRY